MKVIGVVHSLPLPGSYGWSGSLEAVIQRALNDARALERGGVDAILVENYMDYPFKIRVDALEVAAMTKVVNEVIRNVSVDVGVSLLRNSAPEAVAVALATGAKFVRSNQWCWTSDAPEGLLTPVAREALDLMKAFGKKVEVFADVRVKHASPISGRSLCEEARDLGGRCRADWLVVSGSATGEAPDPGLLDEVKACSKRPVTVGSGVTPENVASFRKADAIIVGTYFKKDGVVENPVDEERVRRLVETVRTL